MQRLYLHIQAPFAAFRGMQAGVYRSTMPIIPPSAAYGLVLNLAGIESRGEDDGTTTQMRSDLPPLRLALGQVRDASVSTLYQQLHSYPVGNSGKEFQHRTHGAKYWIAPVRREVLVGLDVVIGVESADAELLVAIRSGLRGELERPRYGLPFAGDNNFLFDRIDALTVAPSARWFTPLTDDQPRASSVRLTVAIDRADASRTRTALLAPDGQATPTPPDAAWLCVPEAA
jgi:CRISPR-associated protein Cas5t